MGVVQVEEELTPSESPQKTRGAGSLPPTQRKPRWVGHPRLWRVEKKLLAKDGPAPDANSAPLAQFIRYFLWHGKVGFGGQIALAGHMQQDLDSPFEPKDLVGVLSANIGS